MTEEEAIKKLKAIHQEYESSFDDEQAHSDEDDLMLEIIRSFGWKDFLSVYHSADHSRWCA